MDSIMGIGDRDCLMKAKLLRIYIGESGRYEGKPAYHAIVECLRSKGIAGATVFRGFEGYGIRSILHTASILRLSEDLPVIIEVVDTEERLKPVIPIIKKMAKDKLIIIQDVEIVAGHEYEA
jgi:PII-like signaling protein